MSLIKNKFVRLISKIIVFLLITLLAYVLWNVYLMRSASDEPLKNPYTKEQRQKVDIRLFNELAVRTHNWRESDHTWLNRYRLIKSFADEGYELAELTLRLFDFGPEHDLNQFFIDREAFYRLKKIADQGDPSAQCLYVKAGRSWGGNIK